MAVIKAWELQLQELISAGKLIPQEDLKLPEVYGPGRIKYITVRAEIMEI